jgi:hypothetical protein
MNRRDGETANRGVRHSTRLEAAPFRLFAHSPILNSSSWLANQPLLRLVDHLHELPDYLFVRIINFQKLLAREIAMMKREFHMDLGFSRFRFRVAEF